MRVVLDCRYAFPHLSGIGRYAVNLARGLAEHGGVQVIALTAVGEDLGRYLPSHPAIEVVSAPGSPRSPKQQWVLRHLLKRLKPDLCHAPDAFAPLWTPCPVVITIHDMIPLAARGELGAVSLKSKVAPLWAGWQKLQCRQAARVLTTTNHSAVDIRKFLSLDPAKLRVVNPGVAPAQPVAPAEVATIRQRLGLTGPYILFVSRREPYKNLVGLVRAMGHLKSDLPQIKLVAVGHRDPRFPQPEQEAERLGVADRLLVTGHLSDRDVAALYAGAADGGALGLASFYEGFGYPPLEALSYGVPVLASRLTSLPEVLGDAAVYVEAADPADIARGIREVIENPALRASVVAAGHERLARFTLERQAQETLAVYREVISR